MAAASAAAAAAQHESKSSGKGGQIKRRRSENQYDKARHQRAASPAYRGMASAGGINEAGVRVSGMAARKSKIAAAAASGGSNMASMASAAASRRLAFSLGVAMAR